MPRLDISLGKCSVSKEDEVIKLDPKDSPLYQMFQDQAQKRGPSEQITPTARWAEDEYVKVRWYHIRWQWLQLWAKRYWREEEELSGILCPILGRHWYKDWRGLAMVFDRWDIEWVETYMRCYHCGQHTLIKRWKNPGQEEKVYKIADMPFEQIK